MPQWGVVVKHLHSRDRRCGGDAAERALRALDSPPKSGRGRLRIECSDDIAHDAQSGPRFEFAVEPKSGGSPPSHCWPRVKGRKSPSRSTDGRLLAHLDGVGRLAKPTSALEPGRRAGEGRSGGSRVTHESVVEDASELGRSSPSSSGRKGLRAMGTSEGLRPQSWHTH